jgi:hypothetical protein
MKKTMKVTPKSTGIINRILLRIYINIKIPDSGLFSGTLDWQPVTNRHA